MNNDPNKRQVPVTYLNSGETRLSAPVPVHAPRQDTDAEPRDAPAATASDTPSQSDTAASVQSGPVAPVESGNADAAPTLTDPGADGAASPKPHQNLGASAPPEKGSKPAAVAKVKLDIETLEQFIEYAYGRKGQRVTLKGKTEKLIAQNPRLDDAALSRLLALAAGDALLSVPRQLLLVSREIDGYPALRAALASFVSNVMLRNPVFADAVVQGALRNLPEANPAADALSAVVQFTPREADGKDPLKGAELQALRRNAANLFVTWLANNRAMNADDLAALLFQVVWQPAARELSDDNARLRALTEVEQAAGVGLACLRFRQQAIEARASQEQTLREGNDLRMRLAANEAQRLRAEEERDALQAELHAVRAQTSAEVAELKRQHAEERTHLHHGQEQLGGRLVRRLDDAVETLEVGLRALRNKTPRIEVMLERAELVVDALRAEIKNLREE